MPHHHVAPLWVCRVAALLVPDCRDSQVSESACDVHADRHAAHDAARRHADAAACQGAGAVVAVHRVALTVCHAKVGQRQNYGRAFRG
jgi:hypothetical protein